MVNGFTPPTTAPPELDPSASQVPPPPPPCHILQLGCRDLCLFAGLLVYLFIWEGVYIWQFIAISLHQIIFTWWWNETTLLTVPPNCTTTHHACSLLCISKHNDGCEGFLANMTLLKAKNLVLQSWWRIWETLSWGLLSTAYSSARNIEERVYSKAK